MQLARVRDITEAVADGLRESKSKTHIISQINELDNMWVDGLKMSECKTDLEVDKTVSQLTFIVEKMVV